MTAADKILQKALVGSGMDSRQWSAVQAGLRDRAFFSATVEDVRVLGAFREAVAKVAAGEMSSSDAHTAMRDALTAAGYRPPDAEDQGPGGIRNLMNERRLDLILKTNVQQARGWAQFMEGTTPGALLAYPAQRLVRVRQRRMPRDWAARWKEAGDAVGWQGACRDEFVALKLSPIWAQLSRFGTPYPPFDFNSGMGVEDVGKRKARELGLLDNPESGDGRAGAPRPPQGSGAQPPVVVPPFNANLQATVPNMGEPERQHIKRVFGDQASIEGNVVKWRDLFAEGAPAEPVRLPASSGIGAISGRGGVTSRISRVTVPPAAASSAGDYAALIPALLREGGVLEALDGTVLKAVMADAVLQAVRIEPPKKGKREK